MLGCITDSAQASKGKCWLSLCLCLLGIWPQRMHTRPYTNTHSQTQTHTRFACVGVSMICAQKACALLCACSLVRPAFDNFVRTLTVQSSLALSTFTLRLGWIDRFTRRVYLSFANLHTHGCFESSQYLHFEHTTPTISTSRPTEAVCPSASVCLCVCVWCGNSSSKWFACFTSLHFQLAFGDRATKNERALPNLGLSRVCPTQHSESCK